MSVVRIRRLRSHGGGIQIPQAVALDRQQLTATTSSQVSSLVGQSGEIWEIQTMTAAIEVVFGQGTLTAGNVDTARRLMPGEIYHFGCNQSDQRCAIILAT